MEDSPEPYSCIASVFLSFFNTFNTEAAIALVAMLAFLVLSALISGSEIAFFSLKPFQVNELKNQKNKASRRVLSLIDNPKTLLATILISNTVVNIAVIVLSSYVTSAMFNLADFQLAGYVIQVIVVTFLILLFGEVLPKVYATQNSLGFAVAMSGTILNLRRLFKPFSWVLVSSTDFIDKRVALKRDALGGETISQAMENTETDQALDDDRKMLHGIVQFGSIYAREIMKSRMEVVAVDVKTPFPGLIKIIVEAGYSRIPVYTENFDNVTGILYIKDLLPYLDSDAGFPWNKLIRKCFFVPESKKINELLKEFQEKKIHMAIVVDEYGGTSGIITLEDILEEIVGEINDEFDIEETIYSRLDSQTYIFEGRTLLKDFCKITGIDYNQFNSIKGEADTLAGLILEIKQELPFKGEKLSFDGFDMMVEAVDNRRIKQIKVRMAS